MMSSTRAYARRFSSMAAIWMLSLLWAGSAYAHVTVQPNETTQGSYEKFVVRVPTEKEIATVKVEVRFPDSVTISRFEPKPGWTYQLTKDGSGKITGVTRSADGEGLGPTEFGEFAMQGRVADDAREIVWKAYQTYQDGTVVEWVGAAGSDKPASVTEVKPKPAGAGSDSHGHTAPASGEPAAGGAGSGSTLSLTVSVAALVVSLLALLLAVRRKPRS